MLKRFCLASCLVLLALPAVAGDLRVRVTEPDGEPVHDAVVSLISDAASGPVRFSWPMEIVQRDKKFDPFVLVAPAGASVSFPNYDPIRHHVYSFSEAGPFELRLYGHGETHQVSFSKVGIVAIGCNIHDSMAAYIYVVDTPYAMKTDEQGYAVLADVPPGAATLRVWHPQMRSRDNLVEREAVVATGDAIESFEVRLRTPSIQHHAY